jgi:HEAT repeat protein
VNVRLRRREALVKCGQRAVTPLIAALQDADGASSRHDRPRAWEIGDLRAVLPLIDAPNDQERFGHTGAVLALKQFSLRGPLLTARMGASRFAAARPRAGSTWQCAGRRLIAALNDADEKVGDSAAEALGEIGDPRAIAPLILASQETFGAIAGLKKFGESAVLALIASLKDADPTARFRFTQILGWMGKVALAPLVAALKDADAVVRSAAALALGQLRDARATAPLHAALQDEDGAVRSSAALALGKLGDPQAVAPLITALESPDADIRRAAAEMLGELDDADADVRSAAAEALGRLGNFQAVAPLVAALKADLREPARRCAGEIGTPTLSPADCALPDDHGGRILRW